MLGGALSPRDQARRLNTAPLQGRGRGWGLSTNILEQLQDRAREMRNNPTEPEKRLWRHLSRGQLLGFKFRRQQVIGRHIADFVCPAARLIVEVDGDTHDAVTDAGRDVALSDMGYRTIRVTNRDVMDNIEGVLAHLSEVLSAPLPFRGGEGGGGHPSGTSPADYPHPNPSPEGEGLDIGDPP